MIFIALLSSCLAAGDTPGELTPSRQILKENLTRGVSLPPDSQTLTIPDLRTPKIALQYLSSSEPARIEPKGSGFCITIPREQAAKAFLMIDAGLHCVDSSGCQKVVDYAATILNQCPIEQAPLLEEFDTASAPSFRDWDYQSAAPSSLPSINGMIFTIQAHELGHLALKHPVGERSDSPVDP